MTSVRDLQEGVANLKLAHESGKNSTAAASSAEQLSADLQLFLEHPNLRAALSDGSLNLANFSTDIADELERLETECIQLYRDHSDEISQLESDLETVQAVLALAVSHTGGAAKDLQHRTPY